MSTSSIVFLFCFFPAVLAVYYVVRFVGKKRSWSCAVAKVLLLLASLFFYAWAAVAYIPHLLVLTLLVYALALGIHNTKDALRKVLLAVGVVCCVGFLLYYKYLDFFGDILNRFFSLEYQDAGIIQPLGISFLVFSLVSYLVDVYRTTIKADKNILNVFLWSFFFAKITSGPIVRYAHMYREKENMPAPPRLNDVSAGARRFVIGLAKKVILANTLGLTVDKIFAAQPDGISTPVAWVGIICYTFQIYLDFSGYSDMALGMARMLGFRFEENFNYPYISKTLGEFWRRWHISLSTWLRDYLYFPLGGSRRGNVYVNLVIVFLISGLWHGASLHFVAWGAWYGVFMIIDRLYRRYIEPRHKLPAGITWLFTILVVVFGWVLFRASDTTQAVSYLLNLVGIGANPDFPWGLRYYLDNRVIAFLVLSVLLSTPVFQKLSERYENTLAWQLIRTVGTPLLFVVSVLFVLNTDYSPFLYAQF